MRIKPLTFAAMIAAIALAGSDPVLAQGKKLELQWFGQAAFKITTPGGKVIMIDPFITKNPKTPAELKDLSKLGKIDLILVTHAHGDHLGDSVELAKTHNAPLIGPAGMNQQLLTLGVLPANLVPRMNKSGTVTPIGEGIKITMTRAEHSSELVMPNPMTGKDETYFGGEPVGFVVEFENGFKLYHMGDTGVFGDMKWIGDYYKPNLILIPIGGHFTMGPKDAAYATKQIKPKAAIPMHYGTFPPLKGTPDEYKKALGETKVNVMAINPGDKASF